MRTLAVVAPSYYFSRRGRLCWSEHYTGGVRWPHLRVMGVWRERPLDGVLHSDTNLPVDGGVVAG